MDDLLSEFLTETSESLSELDVQLVRLEQNPNDLDLLANIFRIVHTIKGTCGFLGLPRLEAVAHASENVLGKIREGEMEVSPRAVSLILMSLDRIKALMAALEQTEQEPEGDDSDLIKQLNALADGHLDESTVETAISGGLSASAVDESRAASFDEPLIPNDDEISKADADTRAVSQVAEIESEASNAVPVPTSPDKGVQAKAPAQQTNGRQVANDEEPKVRESTVASQTIRVHVDLLENLMTMVSELVLTRNQLLQILRSHKDSEFATPLQRLNHVTSELQEGVMKTRMQPIGNAWAKLPRMVRDLALECGKKIDLQMFGAETELDRQVLDMIKDPLTHMVRNSADHGLESPQDRLAAGKSEIGRITLNAYHEGGHIIIEIADDGRGLDIERIKTKIVTNGLATESELGAMNDSQIQQFIFKPGFSTAQKVTAVSGRGVGMDVVRTNIEKIGGNIELKSTRGRGSTFMIKIPLTLAIVNALIVEAGAERFAIPQISVDELVRASAHSEHKIERINNAPVLRLRNRLLPLVTLKKLLKLDDGEELAENNDLFIVVTQVGTYMFGIIVDRVFDTEEIVVKPTAPILRHINMFSGNTILGDGSVIMILDPNGIAAATGELSIAESHLTDATKHKQRRDDLSSLLVFKAGGKAPKAVPLALVARLEEIDLAAIEYSNNKPVVQYRDQLMPLVSIDGTAEFGNEGRTPVLVFADRERSMGLVVDEIVDIVEEKMNVQLSAERPGLLGSAIISGKATEVIDAGFFLTQAFADWFDGPAEETQTSHQTARVLLVDDSPFFRNLLTPLLTVAGYDVTTIESGRDALQLCEDGEDFDVIISDIEMPGMNGFEFAQEIRTATRWKDTPLVALSGYTSQKDLERGREAGFSDYVAKFDREGLLQTLAQTLAEHRGAA